MKKGHFAQCRIDFENSLTEAFISTFRVLKEEKLLDLTLHENRMAILSYLA